MPGLRVLVLAPTLGEHEFLVGIQHGELVDLLQILREMLIPHQAGQGTGDCDHVSSPMFSVAGAAAAFPSEPFNFALASSLPLSVYAGPADQDFIPDLMGDASAVAP